MTHSRFHLVLRDEEGRGYVLRATQSEYRLGRGDSNDIQLRDRNVSRQHALISFAQNVGGANDGSEAKVSLYDLDSSTGVFLNGARVQGESVVTHGDVIRIGDYQIKLNDFEEASPGATREYRKKGFDIDSVTTSFDGLGSGASAPVSSALPSELDDKGSPTRDFESFDEHTDQVAAYDASITKDYADQARFVVMSSIFAGTILPLEEGEYTVGRTENNDIVIAHRSISRTHAKVWVQSGSVRVVDLGGTNGVVVNDDEVDEATLEDGDIVELGNVLLRFVAAGERFQLSEDDIEIAAREDMNEEPKTKGRWRLFGG